MKSENIVSKNNMIINTIYIDKELCKNSNVSISKCLIESFRRLKKILVHILGIIKNGIPKTMILLKGDIFPRSMKDYDMLMGFDHTYELNYEFSKSINRKIAVYTAVFSNYDSIKEPLFTSEYIDYYIFTDQIVKPNSIWKKIDIDNVFFNGMDGYHKSKYIKMHPHEYFSDYEYSIWVDGNIQIVADLLPLVDRIPEECSMASFQNPLHNCIYTEKNFLVYYDAVRLSEIEKQLKQYKKEGFPKHFGMREFSIILRKHNDHKLMELMDQWWNEVNIYTMRDQISFPYLLWKNGYNIDYVYLLGENWRYNPRFLYAPHSWRIKY